MSSWATPSFRPLSGKWGYRLVKAHILTQKIAAVSVPSRGNGVIDFSLGGWSPLLRAGVSVPSRGNGVIDLALIEDVHAAMMFLFPSPLGEMGLSIGMVESQ